MKFFNISFTSTRKIIYFIGPEKNEYSGILCKKKKRFSYGIFVPLNSSLNRCTKYTYWCQTGHVASVETAHFSTTARIIWSTDWNQIWSWTLSCSCRDRTFVDNLWAFLQRISCWAVYTSGSWRSSWSSWSLSSSSSWSTCISWRSLKDHSQYKLSHFC